MFRLSWGRIARGQLFCATYEILSENYTVELSHALEYLNIAHIKFFIFLTLFMVDQFSIVICYCKMLSAISKTSPWFTLIFEVFC